jgi:[acyl-carrier-protein] S-malonyltransferase
VRAPRVPVIVNVRAAAVTDPEEIKRCLVEQVTGTVRWRECVLAMVAAGVTQQFEIGSGKVLTGLAGRIDKSLKAQAIGTPADIEAAVAALAS